MEKSRILAIGNGGCGCNLLDTFLDLDTRYTGIFMNTNLAEMENLKHFDRKRRCFYISNADGTGKNRLLAEKYMKEEAPKFAEMIKKFINQDMLYFFASMGGGTGSKAIIVLPLLVKQLCPEKSLNIVATFPSSFESDVEFKNTIDTWNEIVEFQQNGIIDTVQFINNDKLNDKRKTNLQAMSELNDGFETFGGNIDSSDSEKIHGGNGYKVILKLNNNFKNIDDAISIAKQTSIFYIPEDMSCTNLIANINPLSYGNNLENIIRNIFKVDRIVKINYNTKIKHSTIVLGGCYMPKYAIDDIRKKFNLSKEKIKNRINQSDLLVEIETNKDENNIKYNQYSDNNIIKPITNNSKLSSDELNKMFSDENFWNLLK